MASTKNTDSELDQKYDFFGNPINIGDWVITGTPINRPRGFSYGQINRFTSKKIVFLNGGTKLKFGKWTPGIGYKDTPVEVPAESSINPEDCLVIDEQYVMLKILKDKK